MAVEVFAWNVKDGLGDQERNQQVTEAVLRADADLVMLSEAGADNEQHGEQIQSSLDRFSDEGYRVVSRSYADTDNRRDTHVFVALGRSDDRNIYVYPDADAADRKAYTVDMGIRQAAAMTFLDKESDAVSMFYGVHLDDRSEATRQGQAQRLLYGYGQEYFAQPTIVAGDFNALHRADRRAKGLRAAGYLLNRLPTIDPGEFHELSGARKLAKVPARIGSLGSRLVEMAHGGTMRRFKDAGFKDADPSHSSTMTMAGRALFQLDHIMHTTDIEVVDSSFRVHDAGNLSDHHAVAAKLRVLPA